MHEAKRLLPGTGRVNALPSGVLMFTCAYELLDDVSTRSAYVYSSGYRALASGTLVVVVHVKEQWAHVLHEGTLGWVWAPHLSNA